MLQQHFRREIPSSREYQSRLNTELYLSRKLNFDAYFLRVREILDLTRDIPHLTRGSAGSSLICYLLGITDIDPIKEKIPLERFMHPLRTDTPDIDIDYPWYLQEEVMQRVFNRWPGKVARVSNHITYQKKSAKREALRRLGYRKKLPRYFNVSSVLPGQEEAVEKLSEGLLGKTKGLSLHCGGVVIFEDPIPPELKVKENQIHLDKREIEEKGLLKIDLLSNRGLGQLVDIDRRDLLRYPEIDDLTCQLLCKGDTIGVTQAESPAFRKMLRALQPRCRADLILAMALIRPAAASRGRKASFFADWEERRSSNQIVFEEDANQLITTLLKCSLAEADMYRRAFAKQDIFKISEFSQRLGSIPNKKAIIEDLSQMREYSLCKAHAISYGRMVWALTYQKAHNPKKFWWSALNNCQSMYRPWVHYQEAKAAGWKIKWGKGPWKMDGKYLVPTGQLSLIKESGWCEYQKRGWWSSRRFMPGCYLYHNKGNVRFRGIVATSRSFRKEDEEVTFVTIGTSTRNYIDLILPSRIRLDGIDLVEGKGHLKQAYQSYWVEVTDYNLINAKHLSTTT